MRRLTPISIGCLDWAQWLGRISNTTRLPQQIDGKIDPLPQSRVGSLVSLSAGYLLLENLDMDNVVAPGSFTAYLTRRTHGGT